MLQKPIQQLSCFAMLLSLSLGCQEGLSPVAGIDISAVRQQFILSDEPADPMTVLDLREREGGFQEGNVVLVGQIGGMPNPWSDQNNEPAFPWREDQAAFFLVDPSTVEGFGDHEHTDGAPCAFCLKRAADSADSVAAITFNDASGKPLAMHAKQLFDLQENDMVVIQGRGEQLGGGLIVVNATGIYVRR